MYKSIAIWVLFGLMMILVFNLLETSKPDEEMVFSDFSAKLQQGDIAEVTIQQPENLIVGVLKSGERFKSYAPDYPDLVKELRSKGVRISAKPEHTPWYMSVLFNFGPIILLVFLWVFFMRQMQAGGNKALSFGRSRAKLVSDKGVKVTFTDVAGIEEAKEEVTEIIEFLKDPQKFQKLGGKIPKGVMLVGPPGAGKTLLAKAIAGEAEVPFFSISGSDFVEMFVGVGASRVRDLFEQAKKNSPCIIFIDEIDAVGRHRGAGLGGGHDEREQTLNQLLVELDGFAPNEGIIVLAATNRPDVLDPALLRPGRFDRQVVVPLPDVKGRLEIIKVHSKKIPLEEDVELETLARGTPGFSGADLANLINEAALLAARRSKTKVAMIDFEDSKDKVMMGKERKSMIISEEEKTNTAYHEAGHTLVAKLTPGTDPLHKVSIIPRGMALGITQQLPADDKYTYSKDHVLNMLAEWGMSDAMGPLTFGKREEQIFLGKEITRHKDYSEKTAEEIDAEIKEIIGERYNYSKKLLLDNKETLLKLANALLDRETLDASEIDDIIHGKELAPSGNGDDPQKKEAAPSDTADTEKPDEAADTSSDETTA